ncbi:TPA: restriction endonuclease subunit S [Pseudomonas aeruginosa]
MSEWVESPLAQLATFQKGRKVETSPFDGVGYAPYLGASGLEGGNDGYAATRLAAIAKSTDTLMLWDGERSGLVGYGRQGVVASTVSKLSPTDKIEPRYLYYALSDRFDWIQHRRTGTGVPHVPKDLGRLLKLRYPKQRAVQRRIASILIGIDTAIEKTEALITKYQQIKAGLMHDLFTRGVLPNGQLRPPREQAPELYQETVIGWIPKEWIFTTCSKVCEKIIDCKNRTPPETSDGFPVIRTPNVRDGEFVDAELLYTDERSYVIWTMRGKPKSGDIVITREAPVGEVCMIPERHPAACLGQRMMLYRPNQQLIDPRYFLYALQSHQIQNRLDLISGGSTVGHVRVGDIRDLWMFMPESSKEQIQIASALDSISEKLRSELAQREKLRNKKSGLMHDLLTGKVPIKVEEPEAVDG